MENITLMNPSQLSKMTAVTSKQVTSQVRLTGTSQVVFLLPKTPEYDKIHPLVAHFFLY